MQLHSPSPSDAADPCNQLLAISCDKCLANLSLDLPFFEIFLFFHFFFVTSFELRQMLMNIFRHRIFFSKVGMTQSSELILNEHQNYNEC